MFVTPDSIHLASGSAEGLTPLNAFDNALMAAGVHNLNLVKVSSIVPKDTTFRALPSIAVGSLAHTVYSEIVSNVPGEIISTCIAAGVGSEGGVLMEYHHRGRGEDAERVLEGMVAEAFEKRGWTLEEMKYTTAEHVVDRLGCAVSAAVMWRQEAGS